MVKVAISRQTGSDDSILAILDQCAKKHMCFGDFCGLHAVWTPFGPQFGPKYGISIPQTPNRWVRALRNMVLTCVMSDDVHHLEDHSLVEQGPALATLIARSSMSPSRRFIFDVRTISHPRI